VSDNRLEVANWKGLDLDRERLEQLALPLNSDSIFALAIGEPYYRGAIPADVPVTPFYEALGIGTPREVLILPLYGDGRLEAVLYGDGGTDEAIEGPADQYQPMLDRISMALKILELRRRLCPPAPAAVDPSP
jgi:hypothetical protein